MPELNVFLRPKSKLVTAGYPARIIACLVVLGIHVSLFYESSSFYLWAFIIGHSLIYPHLVYLLSSHKKHERRNIILDGFLYGCCITLWGFSPLSTVAFISGMWMTSFTAGGLTLLLKSALTMSLGVLVSVLIVGAEYRETLPLIANIITSVGLLGFGSALGYAVVKINTNLIKAQKKLSEQALQMQETSELAYAVNAHLDLDTVMNRVIETLKRMFSFEQVYITLIDSEGQKLVVVKSYGESLSPQEHALYEGYELSLDHDQKSIFVAPLLQNQPFYQKRVTPELVAQTGCSVDQQLYKTKPSKSILYLPLTVEEKVIGGIGFINYQTPLDIEQSELDKISHYVVQISTAIRNSLLFEELQQTRDSALIAQQAAESSEAAKSHFLANMSHEIRTPMTAIIGYSESLRDDDISIDEKRHFIETIIRSGKHLLTIINDILDLSKIEANKLEVIEVPVPMVSLIQDLKAHISLKAQEKGLSFDMSPIFPLPSYFISDPTRIKQILFNLANNAVKFTQDGSINILIRYEEESDTLYFEIKDTGIGLTPEQQKRVFEPFIQADNSMTRKYGGTGLGLYISKQLAGLLNGELYVDSQPGLGSEFVLALHPGNLSDAEWFNSHANLASEMKAAELSTAFDEIKLNGHVLIAEDNLENQALLTHILNIMGVNFTIVNNGVEALETITQAHFDLILLDIQMPRMGGEETALNLTNRGIKTPIVALTANVMQFQIEKYQKVGFIDFIAKPFDRQHFYQTLKKYLPEQQYTFSGDVLIADDNPVNLQLLKRHIIKIGNQINVTTCNDGADVITQADLHAYDLILLDMEMPNVDGIEALTTLRKNGNITPVYIVSGNTAPEDITYCQSKGALGHLAKPIDQQHLQKVCIKHLSSH